MRINGKGIISRATRIGFQFDGYSYDGFEGDTLASALLANDIRLVGRSFKYHRPRGVLTAGSEEPNALVTVGQGASAEPNLRATQQEIYEGLNARSQNRWPSLDFDLMAVNDIAAPFLGAGFYYKTFMWPKAFWEKLYEPVIRRAAGLGALSGQANPDAYEKATAHCDVLVIGAGPAGLMAALTAAQGGADVILVDEDSQMGGRLLAETYEIDGKPGHIWAAEILAKLEQMDTVRLMTRTTVTGSYDQGTYGALERVSHHRRPTTAPLECFWRIIANQTILATGALERPIAFANNDRPGIMMAGAVRAYLNRWGVGAGQRTVVFGNNDDAYRTALDLSDAGQHVVAYVDSRHDFTRPRAPFPVKSGAQVCDTQGRRGLEHVSIRHGNGRIEKLAADCLAMSGGWNPSLHLTCHMGSRPVWSRDIAAFVPADDAVPNMHPCGAANGIFSNRAILASAIGAANDSLKALGKKPQSMPRPDAEDAATRITPLWTVPNTSPGKNRAWLDFQNDVTVKDVKQAAQENFQSVEHMKRYTTQGMATDQGKNSNVNALAVLADATGRGISETGTTTFRPPYTPIAIAALGAGAQGKGFAPERLTTSHKAAKDAGAPMIEAGLWYRPSYFPKPGETQWRQSCDREVGYVRNSVGICDVSTLGKIDIQGPDAAKLLDFAYTNVFSTLKMGRVRYGLMLREDGHVLDDGTTARLGDTHYVMTTTTAAAGPVLRHLEFIAQVLHPEWDVQMVSVTEQWAQFAVAGPQSRHLLNGLLSTPIDDDSFPFMACGDVAIGGVDARLFRISFSGEHAYEIAVPARFGDSLYRQLVTQAETMDGGAYGMEALNVLRIEKGFITHAEIDGRVTAFDLGMQSMVSQKKDCVGKTMSERAGLMDSGRAQFVGLKPIGAVKKLTAGAFVFDPDDDPIRENVQGHSTSAGYSPTLGHFLAQGFVKGGRARIGDKLRLLDHVRGIDALVEVIDPVAFDPTGGRARG